MSSSEKLPRSEQSRLNGARSQGPVTEEGKARSAANATRHGMYSSRVCLHNEDPALYALLMRLYVDLLKPDDVLETDLVESMVNARWRIRRLESSQTANMDLALSENRQEFEQKWGPGALDPAMEQALTFRALTKEAKTFDALIRFEDRLHRTYERSYRLLLQHRKKFGKTLPSAAELRHLEADMPANDGPAPPQNERNEPERPDPPAAPAATPGLLRKIAAFFILLFTIATPPAAAKCKMPGEDRSSPGINLPSRAVTVYFKLTDCAADRPLRFEIVTEID